MAQLLDKESTPSASSLINLFSVPPTQTVIDHSYWYAAHPVNTVTSDGPYQFHVSSGPDYLQLGKNYLYMKLKITKPNGTALTEDDCVAPINMLGKTFIKQVKVGVNGKLAFDSGSMYAYRSYLETELNYSSATKQDSMKPALYIKDEPANKIETEENVGYTERAKPFRLSKVVELMAPIHCDLFLADRLMLSNTQINLEIHRNSDQFSLLCFKTPPADPSYKIKVEEMIWYVKRLQLTPSVHMAIESTIIKNPAKYPIRRVALTKIQIGPGRHNTPTSSVFDGQIPRRIILGFVETDSYFGSYRKSPFAFKHNDVSEIYVQAGGHTYPREPLKLDFENKFYSRAYLNLIDTLGLNNENRTNNITMDDFENHTCLYAFDLTPDESDADNWELIKDGTTTVHCTFAKAIKEPGLEMIVYAEFDNLAMIDRNRSIYFDYTV